MKKNNELIWANINAILFKTFRLSCNFNRMKEYLYELLNRKLGIDIEKDCKYHAWKRRLEQGEYKFNREDMVEEIIRKNYDQVKDKFFRNLDEQESYVIRRKVLIDKIIKEADEHAKQNENEYYWEDFKQYIALNYMFGLKK